MSRANSANRNTNRQVETAEPGYSGDGLSMYSHQAARSRKLTKYGIGQRSLSTRGLIDQQERQLRDLLVKRLRLTGDRLRQCEQDISRKEAFVRKLWDQWGSHNA